MGDFMNIAAAKELKSEKQRLLDHLEKIEHMPQAQRWREAKNFLIKINPKVAAIDREFCDQVNLTRLAQNNDVGSSKSGDVRHLLDMPTFMYEMLLLVDPQLNRDLNLSHDNNLKRECWRKLANVFPEYRVAGKI